MKITLDLETETEKSLEKIKELIDRELSLRKRKFGHVTPIVIEKKDSEETLKRKDITLEMSKKINSLDYLHYKEPIKLLNLKDLIEHSIKYQQKLDWKTASSAYKWLKSSPVVGRSGEIELSSEENFRMFIDVNRSVLEELDAI